MAEKSREGELGKYIWYLHILKYKILDSELIN